MLVSGTTKTMAAVGAESPRRVGHLLTPANWNSVDRIVKSGLPWACDNGAYAGFKPQSFWRMCERVAGKPWLLWVACPDVVGNAADTLRWFRDWQPAMRALGLPVALVAQDGLEYLPIPWDDFSCLFIGGSTEWKLSDAAHDLAKAAKDRGKWRHMGRVNSLRRMRRAQLMGCDSIDGSSASMFGEKKIRQYVLWLEWLDRQRILHLERGGR